MRDDTNEKTTLLEEGEGEDTGKSRRFGTAPVKKRRLASFSLISLLTVLFIVFGSDVLVDDFDGAAEFDWDLITPSEKLENTPCFNGFQCAKLILPLDYTKNSSSEKAIIAIVTYPAQISGGESSEEWGGPILVNPGGPGGSGVQFVLEAGKNLQRMTGEKFSIVGFDPRGVGNTIPSASCFKNELDRTSFAITDTRVLAIAGDDVQGEFFARRRGLATFCKNEPDMARHGSFMGTAFVARDMLRISDEAWAAAKKEPKGLQYWGFSYGTVLGATFASMFPDKVERMILDGVVDGPDYMAGNWSKNLLSTEEGVDKFFEYCEGSKNCTLNNGNSTAIEMRERVSKILKGLKHYPITAIHNSQIQLITYSLIIKFMFQTLKEPLSTFDGLAETLSALERGDMASALGGMRKTLPDGRNPHFTCDIGSQPPRQEVGHAILCSDAPPINDTDEEYMGYYKFLKKQSPAGADTWANIRAGCLGWGFQAAEKISSFGGVTKNPILFIGNTRDPVTPLENAKTMSALFPASEVLTQDSEGHCSDVSPSLCTMKAIRDYFGEGEMPAAGTVCLPEMKPFSNKEGPKGMSVEADAMLAIARAAARARPEGLFR